MTFTYVDILPVGCFDTRWEALISDNRLMYLGIVLIVAAVSVWLGAELTKRIEWTVPYVGGAGVALVILGVVLEFWRTKKLSSSGS